MSEVVKELYYWLEEQMMQLGEVEFKKLQKRLRVGPYPIYISRNIEAADKNAGTDR